MKVQTMVKRYFVICSLALSFFIGGQAFAASPSGSPLSGCNEKLSALDQSLKYWNDQIGKAAENGNLEGMIYGMVSAGLKFPGNFDLTLKEKRGLRSLKTVMELESFQKDAKDKGFLARVINGTLEPFGIGYLVNESAFGVVPEKKWQLKPATIFGKDFVWTLAPLLRGYFLFRSRDRYETLQSAFKKLMKSSTLSEEGRTLISSKLWEKYGNPKPSAYFRFTRFASSLILATTLMITGNSFSDLLLERGRLPEPYGPYTGQKFMQDVRSESTPNLASDKTLIVYDSNFMSKFPAVWDRPNPVLAVNEMKPLVKNGAEIVTVQSMSGFLNMGKAIGEYDNIVVLTHGDADDTDLGWAENYSKPFPKMKKGANIIFYSCAVGQKGGDSKNLKWVNFSKRLLNGGKAVTASQTILMTKFDPDSAGPQQKNLSEEEGGRTIGDDLFVLAFLPFYKFSGIENAMTAVHVAQEARKNEYFFKPNGIVVYDSATDHVDFIPDK